MGIPFGMRGLFGLLLFGSLLNLQAAESNFWPLLVEREDSPVGRPDQTGSLGPLFSLTEQPGERILSIRPLWTTFADPDTGHRSSHLLYPFANWFDRETTKSGHVLNIIQYRRNHANGGTFFQFFPFVFSDQTGDPETSYFALWPLAGELKDRFWRDRIQFAFWPLWVRTEKGDETRLHVPWPFIQTLRGPHSRGFGLWPLYGRFERDNDYVHTWALWPLHYHYRDDLDKEVPYVRFGVLPFYHRETAAGLRSETFVWPFFGYTREWEPRVLYAENRYFWPFLVQGRGEERHVNRWMPVYTHETRPGHEKNWYLWPFLKTVNLTAEGFREERTSLLYFLYRDKRQHFADATTRLATLWPLAGYWDDGRGRRQLQVLDPFTAFFPSNRKVKENWSPLFALYRYDEREDNGRHSLLWDLLVFEKDETGPRALYLGPLFEWVQGSHWDVLKGLVGSRPEDGSGGLHFFWRNQ